MRIIDMRPPRIAMALTVIAAAIHWLLKIWGLTRFSAPRTGVSVGIAGFFLMMWPWVLFKKQDLAVCLPGKTTHIIKAGPYHFSRNPMYLGMILIMAGLALYIGTLPFYFSAIAYFAVINFVFVPYEEKKLTNSFGAEYLQYKSRVRRWI